MYPLYDVIHRFGGLFAPKLRWEMGDIPELPPIKCIDTPPCIFAILHVTKGKIFCDLSASLDDKDVPK